MPHRATTRGATHAELRRAIGLGAALAILLTVLGPTPSRAAVVPGWVPVVNKNAEVTINDIEAVSPSNVWAVGYKRVGLSKVSVAYHWNGTSMTEVVDASAGPDTDFASVLVLADDDIWILSGSAWARHWDGASWSTVSLTCCFTHGIDGVSADDIWVIGSDPRFEHWNGSAWSVVAPSFPVADHYVDSIDMVSANDGWAVGYKATDAIRPFITHWNGSTWDEVALPATDPGQLGGVRAFGPNDVYVAGWTQGPGDTATRTLVMHWDGTTWSREDTPNVGWLANQLTDIDGTSADDLWAVGGEYLDEQVRGTLALHRDASGWTVSSTPNDPSIPLRTVASAGSGSAWSADAPLSSGHGGVLLRYVDATAHDSSITITASHVNWGEPLAVRGTLAFTDGAFAGQRQIDIQRTGPDGTVDLPPVTTGLRGEFALDDVPATWGEFTYTATFGGDAVWAGSFASGTGVLYGRPTTVTMKPVTSTVTFGTTAKLSVHVTRFTDGSRVGLYIRIGKSKKLVARHLLDTDGRTSFSIRPKRNSRYIATLDDPVYESMGDTVEVDVRPAMDASSIYRDGTSGAYALYHYDTHCPRAHKGCPEQLVVERPKHPDLSIYGILQAHVGGRWVFATDGYFRLDDQGRAKIYWFYSDHSIVGVPFRVRYDFPGDKDHVESSSKYVYFKVVN